MRTLFVTRELPVDAVAMAPSGVRVVVDARARSLTRDEIVTGARDASAEAILVQLTETIDRELLNRLPNVKLVANCAVGVNNIDLAAAKELGVAVTNTPDVLTAATADLAMTLLLGLCRRVREGERIVRSGAFPPWSPGFLLGREVNGRTLGLFGFGRIGGAVAERARAFGMRVLFTVRSRKVDHAFATQVTFDELLAQSDVVSIHAPLTAETRHAFDGKALAKMKRGALLINTARGPLVDEAALVAALESGHLGGAGLDVYEHEPLVHPGLVSRDDVLLLPHVGSATKETRAAMASLALENCFAFLQGGTPRTPVVL